MIAFDRLPRRVQTAIGRCRAGERLCHTKHVRASGEAEDVFVFEPSGRRCGPITGQQAISSGLLKPLGDSLLDPDLSQSWGGGASTDVAKKVDLTC